MFTTKLSRCCSKLSRSTYYWSLKLTFPVKPKWYIMTNWLLFSSFPVTVKYLHWVLFWFRKLSVDFRDFWVFIFCHRANLKTQKPQKIFRSSFFEVLTLSDFEYFPKNFRCSRQNSEGAAQSYQGALTIKAWN